MILDHYIIVETPTFEYNTGLKIMPKMVPAKMSVTKELVPDILHLSQIFSTSFKLNMYK